MFLQIWPLYWSQHGSHLWFWYPNGWQHQLRDHTEIVNEVRGSSVQSKDVVDEMLVDFASLNRLTIADLQRALSISGFRIRRIEMQSDTIEIPRELSHVAVTDLAISGVKLIALPE